MYTTRKYIEKLTTPGRDKAIDLINTMVEI